MEGVQLQGKLCSCGASPIIGSLKAVARWQPGLDPSHSTTKRHGSSHCMWIPLSSCVSSTFDCL